MFVGQGYRGFVYGVARFKVKESRRFSEPSNGPGFRTQGRRGYWFRFSGSNMGGHEVVLRVQVHKWVCTHTYN